MRRSACTALSLPLAVAMLVGMATPAGADTPAQRLERLRAEASALNARIERTNQQVTELVEQHNASRVRLRETREAETRTRARLRAEAARLGRAQERLDSRARAIYVHRDGPLASVEQLLGGRTPHETLTTLTYRRRVLRQDQELVAAVTKTRARLAESADDLRRRRIEQEHLTERLAAQRRAIKERLATRRAELARVDGAVRDAMAEQRRERERRRLAAADTWAAATGQGGGHARGAARQAVAWALRQVGKPYRWGATGLSTFDCSGLTMRAYQAAGVSIPRTSRSQFAAGARVDRDDLQPGDLLFYGGGPGSISHVGMYVGSGRMVESPYTGASVRVASILRGNYVGARRPAA